MQRGLKEGNLLIGKPGTSRETKHARSSIEFTISTLELRSDQLGAPMSRLHVYLCGWLAFLASGSFVVKSVYPDTAGSADIDRSVGNSKSGICVQVYPERFT